ncbi:hypothetical protein B0T26DRAFT_695083 [Lasiosphaeria miniovina]|uniref:Uncharacterized protein n=1 Tax=Lasiosphaeria miniovina TaxID=1954250 RepID=A0AA40B564_9PEZI|nr:uncharacterized protein B0T26DRAFT_695083 [Lasiosphaeria miniovina]KAK0727583.1 hypothetical protein B0T26DRAFT_695083 [Lasiosphaeria miniovina]
MRRLWSNVLAPGFLLLVMLESLSRFSLWSLSVFMGGSWGVCCRFCYRLCRGQSQEGRSMWPVVVNERCLPVVDIV